MLTQILSDLHGHLPKISNEADLLILAGDVGAKPSQVRSIFKKIRETNEVPILYVLGNHEYYDNIFPSSLEKYREVVHDLDITLLERATIEFNGTLFIGCTMWTDYDKGRGEAAARFGMNDFDFIRVDTDEGTRKSTPADFSSAYGEARIFLKESLSSAGEKKVVITHHMPSFSLVSKKFIGSSLNSSFAADCYDLIRTYKPNLWIFGHTHEFTDKTLDQTRCLCNPLGYRGERSNYQERLLVEI
jgi:predicted phosphodiesterase